MVKHSDLSTRQQTETQRHDKTADTEEIAREVACEKVFDQLDRIIEEVDALDRFTQVLLHPLNDRVRAVQATPLRDYFFDRITDRFFGPREIKGAESLTSDVERRFWEKLEARGLEPFIYKHTWHYSHGQETEYYIGILLPESQALPVRAFAGMCARYDLATDQILIGY